jgi:hypothetical protein
MSSAKILIAGVVSIVIQFGLAIARWEGWSAFFAHPALRALAWVTAGLAGLPMRSDGDARKLSACVRPGRRGPSRI